MRIWHLVSSWKHTGPGAAALAQARALYGAGCEIILMVSGEGSLSEKARDSCVPCEVGIVPGTKGQPLGTWHNVLKLRERLRLAAEAGEMPHVLHVHRGPEHFAARLAMKGISPRPRLIRSWYRGIPGVRRSLAFRLARSADALVVPPGAIRCFEGVHSAIYEIQPAVFPDEWETFSEIGEISDDVKIGFFGRWIPRRGILEALEAFRLLKRKRADGWRGYLLGRGYLAEKVKRAIVDSGLSDILVTCDAPEDYRRFSRRMDVAAVLAVGSDGSSRALCRAMAFGAVPVTADIPELVSLLPDGFPKNKHVVRMRRKKPDPASLAELFSGLLDAKSELARKRKLAAEYAREAFAPEHVAVQLLESYAASGSTEGGTIHEFRETAAECDT